MRTSFRERVLYVTVSGFASLGILHAQSTKTFTVDSVKKNTSGEARTTLGFQPGGRFVAANETLKRLIGEAYGESVALPPSRIVGGPDWISSDRFDVEARSETPSPTAEERRQMLRALLAARFKLAVHHETREMPIFALVKARESLGPRLQPSSFDCASLRASGGLQSLEGSPGKPRPCVMRFGGGQIGADGMAMGDLASGQLTRYVGRHVTDRTGLTGPYDWTLSWGKASDGITIFTALQEQLGLKLESERGPVDVLVVDHVEPPSPN